MPWQTVTPMSQRLEFIHAIVEGRSDFRTACRTFGISEKTGYKWRQRFLEGGPAALGDRSHAPRIPAHQVPAALVDAICALRKENPTWGARKLRNVLMGEQPDRCWPAASTITTLLTRHGYIVPQRRRARARAAWASTGLTQPLRANDVWAADFKGDFRVTDGALCFPLTVSDLHSRFVLGCTALTTTAYAPARVQFIRLFETYGLPLVIRTDNGVPFGAPAALGGLSSLAVWWIRLGIRPERIHPGMPQENGSHERMHRTLKAETTRPPAASLAAQERRFERWRETFNTRRPHEALGQVPPTQHYASSPRRYPRQLPVLPYPPSCELRRVDLHGTIRIRSERIFLSRVLAHEFIGIAPDGDDSWRIQFGPLQLGVYSTRECQFTEALLWTASDAHHAIGT